MKQYLRIFLFILLSLSLTTSYGQLYSYTTNVNGSYNSIAPNTTGTALTRQNGLTAPVSACATGFSSTGFTSATTWSDALGAVEAEVTPNAGYQLLVSGFTADLRRSNNGPASVRLAFSVDGGFSWTDKGSDDAPNNAGCGTTTTAAWVTGFTVSAGSSLKFRVYGFNTSGANGILQILNLSIMGATSAANTITTSAASFGPYCQGTARTTSVPFTTVGTFTDPYYVQLSNAAGVFPNDAVSNLISTGTTISPASATIPAVTAAGSGYRVRVVNQTPTYYSSGDNGSNIVINASVTPTVTIIDSPTAVCAGSPVRFSISALTNAGATPTFQWYVNNVATGTNSIYTTSSLSNNDSVYLRLTSNATCVSPASVSSNTVKVVIYPLQTTAIYDTLCPGGSITFNGNTQTTTGSYVAHFSTVNSCDSAVTLNLFVRTLLRDTTTANICQGDVYTHNGHTYTTATVVSDTLSCAHISSIRIVVNAKPNAVATLTGSNQLSTTTFATYQWLRNGTTAVATTQNYTATQNGSYSVVVTDANGCRDTSNVVAVTTIGINEAGTIAAHIYPNPTDAMIYVDAEDISSIDIVDMVGRTVFTNTVNKGTTHTQIDMSTYTNGIYTLIVRNADNAATIRTIAKK